MASALEGLTCWSGGNLCANFFPVTVPSLVKKIEKAD
jgi:hypothetical protein